MEAHENGPAETENELQEQRKQKTILTEQQNRMHKNTTRISLFELIYKGITCKEMLRK